MPAREETISTHDELCVLVAELALDPEADRGAVADRQLPVVHAVGEDCLRMKGVGEINALIVGHPGEVIGAVQDHVARRRLHLDLVQHRAKRNPGPLPDRAPPFNAVVAGDLGAGRPGAQIGQGIGPWRLDQPIDRQPPIGEPLRGMALILGRARQGIAVGPEVRRYL